MRLKLHLLPTLALSLACCAAACRGWQQQGGKRTPAWAMKTQQQRRRRHRGVSAARDHDDVDMLPNPPPSPCREDAYFDRHMSSAEVKGSEINRQVRSRWTPPLLNTLPRRDAIVAAMAGLGAEAAWRSAVSTAAAAAMEDTAAYASPPSGLLPLGTIEQLESGRAVVLHDWLSPTECAALRTDVRSCYDDGHFKNFILSRNPNKADAAANDRWIMPSFYRAGGGGDGPFADPAVGDFELRQRFKARMAQVKAVLARELQDRPSLGDDLAQTHEMEYLRYGAGALLQRHTDEHHVELKRPNGSKLPKKANATRRSVTWMVYLNDDWEGDKDGGYLRLHERAQPSVARVGSRGQDLQVGWLKATKSQGEQPVFLDPLRPGPEAETCVLYTYDAGGNKRDLSEKPFANIALYLGGGDAVARRLMVDNPRDAARFHLIDAPKTLVSSVLPANGNDAGEDGGERVRDVVPRAGTLVMFDSVSLPHEVLRTNRERFGIQGWFHETLGYTV